MKRFPYLKIIIIFGILVVLARLAFHQSGSLFTISTKDNSTVKNCVEIAGAISSFYRDYDKLPVDQPESDWQGDTKHPDLVAILTGAYPSEAIQRNPRHINYLDGYKQARLLSGKMTDGIDFSDEAHPVIYDQWGQPFMVILDTNSDGKIANPIAADPVHEIPGKKALVYSSGPPNADGTRNTDESKFLKFW